MHSILNMKYKPKPVRRVYIPKADGNTRPLGIPTVIDRVIQQAIAQVVSEIYEPHFSENSYGFRPNKSAHDAMNKELENLNEGYEWVIDMDIEKYFDTVNHDKLISILREHVNEREVLYLIRSFLKAGVMENGLIPQGGPLSPILSNIYLDKFDKELEERGLRFVRYADDSNIIVKGEMSANKTKIVRPTKSNFLGFTFWKNGDKWKCKPSNDRKAKLYTKIKTILKRKHAVSRSLAVTCKEVNRIIKGLINYFRIGNMKLFLDKFGQWLRHKIRVIIMKQWKIPKRIYINLQRLNKLQKFSFTEEDIFKVANSRVGWYRRYGMNVVNYMLSPKVLATKKKERPGLVNPLEYYLSRL